MFSFAINTDRRRAARITVAAALAALIIGTGALPAAAASAPYSGQEHQGRVGELGSPSSSLPSATWSSSPPPVVRLAVSCGAATARRRHVSRARHPARRQDLEPARPGQDRRQDLLQRQRWPARPGAVGHRRHGHRDASGQGNSARQGSGDGRGQHLADRRRRGRRRLLHAQRRRPAVAQRRDRGGHIRGPRRARLRTHRT